MNQNIQLHANKRQATGHKARLLRKKNVVPGTVYGCGKNFSIQVEKPLLTSVYKKAGETQVVNLSINNTRYPVIIHATQKHPVTEDILHVEFLIVDLSEKLTTRVPVYTEGESIAVLEGKGILLQMMEEVEVEALPSEIPEKISIDVSSLSSLDQEIKVKDITPPKNVSIISDLEQTVIKLTPVNVSEESPKPSSTTESQENTEKKTTLEQPGS